MFTKAFRVLCGFGFVVAAASAIEAQTINSNITVSANVIKQCRFGNITNVNFGTYDSTSATPDDDGTGSFEVRCTKGTATWIDLNQGLNGTGTATAPVRRMQSATTTEFLGYQLYTDSPGGTVWGAGDPSAGGTGVAQTFANNQFLAFSVFGRIPAGQDIAVGADYTDTVQITVNF